MPVDPQAAVNVAIAYANKPDLQASLMFGFAMEPTPTVDYVEISQEVAEQIRRSAAAWVQELGNRLPEPYDIGRRLESTEVGVLDLADSATSRAFLDVADPTLDLPRYDQGQKPLSDIAFVVVALWDTAGVRATLVRRVTPGRFQLRREGLSRLVFRDGVLNSFTENVIQIDNEYDVVFHGDAGLVVHQDSFERLFGFEGKRIGHVTTVCYGWAAALGVSDAAGFVQCLTADKRYYRKIESVRRRNVLTTIGIAQLEALVVALQIPLTFEDAADGKRVLKVEKSARWRQAVLRLLDDDNLHSPLTATDYEANSKRVRPPTQGI